jgi:hypothetical protein
MGTASSTRASATVERRLLATLVLGAFALRLFLCWYTIDVPGDGPDRAAGAFFWARHRYWPTHGGWPPGFMVVSGLVSLLVPDVLLAPRLLNVVVGSATVALLYAIARRIFGRPVAVASAVLLAWFPLHLFLSASALTEPSALFEVLAAIALVLAATHSRRGGMLLLIPATLVLLLASMTRYETWPLLALFPAYVAWRTGRYGVATAFFVALAAFPVAWSIGNLVHEGDPFVGFNAAIHERAIGETRVGLVRAVRVLAAHTRGHLGWVLAPAFVVGITLELIRLIRRQLSLERAFYLMVVLALWGIMGAFTLARGETVWTRYLLMLFVLSIPFAALPFFAGPLGRRTARAPWIAALALSLTVALSYVADWPYGHEGYWITREQPRDMRAAARFLDEQSLGHMPVVLTPMGWQSTYLPALLPSVAGRTLIVSDWLDDEFIDAWIKGARPAVLLTASGDEKWRGHVEAALGTPVEESALLYTAGDVRVYDLRAITRK